VDSRSAIVGTEPTGERYQAIFRCGDPHLSVTAPVSTQNLGRGLLL
jgi:hypothetical protein